MNQDQFRFVFSDLMDFETAVTVQTSNAEPCEFSVSVNDNALSYVRCSRSESMMYDLADLAVSVNTADRLAQSRRGHTRRISIALPVRNPDVLRRISDDLQDLLFFLTHDDWSFEFTRRQKAGRFSESQLGLFPGISPGQKTEVALWSGGLDSLAGFSNRVADESAERYVFVGSGNNSKVFRSQSDLVVRLHNRVGPSIELVQIPICKSDTSQIPKDRLLRSRGLVFVLMGAAVAVSLGSDRVHIYENGVGAINLPYFSSEVGMDHTRSVHPISLDRIGRLISRLLGRRIEFCNPFIFRTKGQMCEALRRLSLTDLISYTASCDRPHRSSASQCGVCSSCLLRRQALIASGIVDRTRYVVPHECQARKGHFSHFAAMSSQVQMLSTLLGCPSPWGNLCSEYPFLRDTAVRLSAGSDGTINQVGASLVALYQQYVKEWTETEIPLQQKLLVSLTSPEVAHGPESE